MAGILQKEKAVKAVEEAFSKKEDSFIKEMYDYGPVVSQVGRDDLLKVWSGISSVGTLSINEIDSILRFCLKKYPDIGRYDDFLSPLDVHQMYVEFANTIENKATKNVTKRWLREIGSRAEEMYGKDIFQLNRKECIEIISSLESNSGQTLRQAIPTARSYVRWVRENRGFDTTQAFENLTAKHISFDPWVKKNVIKDAGELYSRIVDAISLDESYLGPVVAALLWMKFSLEDMLTIRNEEVQLKDKLIRGRKIPEELLYIFETYSQSDGRVVQFGIREATMLLEDMGFYLKRATETFKKNPLNVSDLRNSLSAIPNINPSMILTSSRLYDLFHLEAEKKVLNYSDFVRVFDLNTESSMLRYQVEEKMRIYDSYKSVFKNAT